jgi:hypothetical protein
MDDMPMRKKVLLFGLILFGVMLTLNSVRAEQPQAIYYQGSLVDPNGEPLPDGSYTLTFAFYDDSTRGKELWEEKQQVNVQGGEFTVELGRVNPLHLSFDKSSWLAVTVENVESDPGRTEFVIPESSFEAR